MGGPMAMCPSGNNSSTAWAMMCAAECRMRYSLLSSYRSGIAAPDLWMIERKRKLGEAGPDGQGRGFWLPLTSAGLAVGQRTLCLMQQFLFRIEREYTLEDAQRHQVVDGVLNRILVQILHDDMRRLDGDEANRRHIVHVTCYLAARLHLALQVRDRHERRRPHQAVFRLHQDIRAVTLRVKTFATGLFDPYAFDHHALP